MNIVCLGDSVTRAVRPGVAPHETFCHLVGVELTEIGLPVTMINSGIGGHTTRDGWARFASDVLAHQPRVVTIMFGINDSYIYEGKTTSTIPLEEFESNLQKMADASRRGGASPVFMTSNVMLDWNEPPRRNETMRPYIYATRRVARRNGAPLVDLYARMSEMHTERVDLQRYFTDSMHPNPKGNELIAQMLMLVLPELVA